MSKSSDTVFISQQFDKLFIYGDSLVLRLTSLFRMSIQYHMQVMVPGAWCPCRTSQRKAAGLQKNINVCLKFAKNHLHNAVDEFFLCHVGKANN